MIRKTAVAGLLLVSSCCVNVNSEQEEQQEFSLIPDSTVQLKIAAAGAEITPHQDSLIKISVKGSVDLDTVADTLRSCEIQGAEAEIRVPAQSHLTVDCEMAGLEMTSPDSCDIEATLAGLQLSDWKAGSANLFMSGGEIHLSPDARNLSLRLRWSGIEIYLPEGMQLNITEKVEGGKVEAEEGTLSEDGLPVNLEIKGGGVEVKREP